MKETFIEKKFNRGSLALIQQINAILANYEAQGFDLSLRQLYYQLVSKNVIANTEQSYKATGELVAGARLAGLIDWDMIVDRGRYTSANSHWENPRDFVQNTAQTFKIDLWEGQDNHVEVMVEKQALEGVLEPVCAKLDIAFTSNKGYSSVSALYECGKRLKERMAWGKSVIIFYLGDHDPSGIDMTRDVLARLAMFSGCNQTADWRDGDDTGLLQVKRIALNMPQIRQYNPPENPAKITDSRYAGYVSKFGESSWELDALEPKVLANLVEQNVRALMDVELWEARAKLQADGRAQLIEHASKL